MFAGLIESLQEWLLDTLKSFTSWSLDLVHSLFQNSVNSVRDNVFETPTGFSQLIVDNLRLIPDTTSVDYRIIYNEEVYFFSKMSSRMAC